MSCAVALVVAIERGCVVVVPMKDPAAPFHAVVVGLPASSHIIVDGLLQAGIPAEIESRSPLLPGASQLVAAVAPVTVLDSKDPVVPTVAGYVNVQLVT